jgi:lipopolysaccharide biosynthesis glycosyltransferase
MIIAAGADDGFAMPMAVTLYSALANMKSVGAVSVYIIDGGISERNKGKLTEVLRMNHMEVQLEWVKPDLLELGALTPSGYYTLAVYLRLLIPELLPAHCERAIYLDSDLVVERDLGQLWERGMDAFPALAVPNYDRPVISWKSEAYDNYPLFGLAPDTPYCNTGVMVMNLNRWRTEKIGRRAIDFARQFPLVDADQGALNIIIGSGWGLLEPKWNVQLSGFEGYARFLKSFSNLSELAVQKVLEDLLREPYILHFTWRIKPWHPIYQWPARLRFFHYLRQSGWFAGIDDINVLMELAWEEQGKYDQWLRQLYIAQQDLDAIVPPGDSFILVDGSTWPSAVVNGWHTIPFLERDGVYWGNPPDDETAIQEVERMRQSGFSFIVFAWPTFWWFDYYSRFYSYLREKYRCVLENDRLVVFGLRS